MYNLYPNIKRLRTKQNLSQTELAHRVGYSDKSMISKIERGEIDLSISMMDTFAKVLGVNITELLGKE